MLRTGIGLLALATLLPAPLLAEPVASPATSPAPRQLSEAEQARLKQSIGKDKASLQQAVAEAQARQRELDRNNAEAAASAAASAAAYVEPEPEVQVRQPTGATILNAFTSGFSREYEKTQAIVNQGNADVAAARQRMLAQQEHERRERERQQAEARLRQQQQAAARQASTAAAAESQRLAQERDARLREQIAAERGRIAAERAQIAAEREKLAAAERAETSRSLPAPNRSTTSGTASSSMTTPMAHGPARAWCQASKVGTYQCMGPTQQMASWEKSLAYALSLAGCTGGQGHAPTADNGGSGFNCGRSLRTGELRMPEYDPYRGGGRPERVTAGN